MKIIFNTLKLILCFLPQLLLAEAVIYTVPEVPWPESFGNHRAVLFVERDAPAMQLDLTWRRHDRNPTEKAFFIIDSISGDTVKNIHRLEINNERCNIIFGPVKKGVYYFYYLPYTVEIGWGAYRQTYVKPEGKPAEDWLQSLAAASPDGYTSLPKAVCREIQSRTNFDSFYPMEIIATKKEKQDLINSHAQVYLLFPESRKFPIRMMDDIPQRWIDRGPARSFSGKAQRNEYYVFQIGLYAMRQDIKKIRIDFSDLKSADGDSIPSGKLTCFNTEGIDPAGNPFRKDLSTEKGHVQPLWIGIDLAEFVKPGVYEGVVRVVPANADMQEIRLSLEVADQIAADRGDGELWRHSRLRWLNSRAGIDEKPVKPYQPVVLADGEIFRISGKEIKFAASGLPSQIFSYNTPVLSGEMSFVIEADGQNHFSWDHKPELIYQSEDRIQLLTKGRCDFGHVQTISTLEADGYIHAIFTLFAERETGIRDIRLEIPMQRSVAEYMIGMGLPGTEVPQKHISKWNYAEDSFWIGNAAAGLWVELRGSRYHGPLLNLYKPPPPFSWHNHDNGGYHIQTTETSCTAAVYSGERTLQRGDSLSFEFSMLITPVKEIDSRDQFTNRYYHSGGQPVPKNTEFDAGVKIVNIHHANPYNPYLNYPFLANDSLKSLVNRIHSIDRRIKLYYTIRELSNHVTEIWALRSLGTEILAGGAGGGYPWLREHFITNYTPQWFHHFGRDDMLADASVLTSTGDSRWYNYYIEGLGWLVKHINIDGLYLDDVAFDRHMLKRMRKIMDYNKPGCLIDLHSNTGFSKGPAKQYTEYFPYIDKLWFGESFLYDKMTDAEWFVEVAGIPFGLMGDMLHAGGNPWLGMVYGMTVRYPWMTEGVSCDPRNMWAIWDSFGIADARMVGYWDQQPVVFTDNRYVKSTAYIKTGQSLIALGNFSDSERTVSLRLDWDSLGLNETTASFSSPFINNIQSAATWEKGGNITLAPRKGLIILLEE